MKAKSFIVVCLSLFCIHFVYANERPVCWIHRHGTDWHSGHPNAVPNVTSDGDDVNLSCDSLINNVDVVIRDQFGNVIHNSIQTIGPNETTIYVPSVDGEGEKATIDLYFDRKHLSGYFEE